MIDRGMFKTIRFKFAANFTVVLLIFGLLFIGILNLSIVYIVKPAVSDETIAELKEQVATKEVYFPGVPRKFRLDKEALEAIRLVEQTNLDKIRQISVISIIPFGVLSFIGGYILAGRMLEPVTKLTLAAKSVDLDSLDHHIEYNEGDDELMELVNTFNEMIDRLSDSQSVRDQFAQDASHELKTPLAVIQTNLEIVLSDDAAEESDYKSAMKVALRAVSELNTLAEDLLLLTKRNQPKVFLNINLKDIVLNVLSEFDSVSKQKNITIKSELIASKAIIYGNEFLLTRLLRNLLDNSFKYSDNGSEIIVKLGLVKGQTELSIKDNGIGIAKSELKNIFKRFYRVDKSRNRKEGGTGLGLSIVQNIAKEHNAKLNVDSKENQGTTFTITFPSL